MQVWQTWLVQVSLDRRKDTLRLCDGKHLDLGERMMTELNCTCLDSWIISYLGQCLLTTLAPASHQTKISYFAKPVPGPVSNLLGGTDSWGWRPSLHQVVDLQPEATGVMQEAESLPVIISALTRLWKWISLLFRKGQSHVILLLLYFFALCSEKETRSSDPKVVGFFPTIQGPCLKWHLELLRFPIGSTWAVTICLASSKLRK